MGVEYTYYNPMPIETQLSEYMSSLSFNFLFAAYSIPNMIAPLFAGLLVGKFGPRIILLISLIISISGQLITMTGVLVEQYSVLIVGRVILGIGSECIYVSQSTIVSMWFDNSEISLALGISLAFPMLGGSINAILTPIIADAKPLYFCFLAGVFMLFLSLFAGIILVILDQKQEKRENDLTIYSDVQESSSDQKLKVETIQWSQLKEINFLSWMILIISGLSVGTILPFMDNINSFAQTRYGLSQKKAGVIVSLPDAISAILTPFIGVYVDKFPRGRTKFILLSFSLLTIGHIIMGSVTCHNCDFSVVPFIILGIAFSSWYSVIMPTIPLSVDERLLGTTFGLSFICQHTMIVIGVFIIGAIKDSYKKDLFYGYGMMSVFLIVLSAICLIFSIFVYWYEQKHRLLAKSTYTRSVIKSKKPLKKLGNNIQQLNNQLLDGISY